MRKGPGENDDLEINAFDGDTIPFEIGGLERTDFQYLGEWHQLVGEDGYGIVYRIGSKEGLVDHEGDPMLLLCIFSAPIGIGGKKVTPDIAERIKRQLPVAMHEIALHMSQYHDNVVAIKVSMPPYMQDELKAHLGLE